MANSDDAAVIYCSISTELGTLASFFDSLRRSTSTWRHVVAVDVLLLHALYIYTCVCVIVNNDIVIGCCSCCRRVHKMETVMLCDVLMWWWCIVFQYNLEKKKQLLSGRRLKKSFNYRWHIHCARLRTSSGWVVLKWSWARSVFDHVCLVPLLMPRCDATVHTVHIYITHQLKLMNAVLFCGLVYVLFPIIMSHRRIHICIYGQIRQWANIIISWQLQTLRAENLNLIRSASSFRSIALYFKAFIHTQTTKLFFFSRLYKYVRSCAHQ